MEDYKKNYKDSMKKIEHLYESVNPECKQIIKYYFPELEESEDERIRKEILEYFHQFENEELRRINISDWIAWLEKQDPKKHEEELEKAYKCADEVQYKKGYEDAKREFEKQGEQKPFDYEHANIQQSDFAPKVEPKFKVGDIITNKKSKDTVEIVQILHDSYCYSGWDGAAIVHSDFRISEQDNWELVEQNPAWSEEDEKMWSTISDLLWEGYKLSDKKVSWNKIRCWLLPKIKSLKERYTWKPSDEQIKALNYVINLMASSESPTENNYYYNVFKDMRTQLKKLREE